jgi:hypothetical protein
MAFEVNRSIHDVLRSERKRKHCEISRRYVAPGMDSNHMVDRFWICCSLLISKVTEVVKSIKSGRLVQNRYKRLLTRTSS